MFVIALSCICFLYCRFGALVRYRPSFCYLVQVMLESIQ